MGRHRRGALIVGLLVIAGTLGVVAQRYMATRALLEGLPNPDLSGVEPQVARQIGMLRAEVVSHPRSPRAWGTLAMSLHVHQLTAGAVRAYTQAAALDDSDFRWPYFAGLASYSMGLPDAVEWYERGLRIDPRYVPLLVRLGQALLQQGRLDDAQRMFERASREDPSSSHAHLGLGQMALANGDLAASQTHLVQAIEADPRHGEARGLLAEVYRRNNDSEQADRELRRARAFEKSAPLSDSIFDANVVPLGVSSWWFLRRGRALFRTGAYDAAIREFRAALEARPDAETRFHLGLGLQFIGQYDEAIRYHRAALEERPQYQEALHNLGVSLAGSGRAREGMQYVARAKEVDPTTPDAYLRLGALHEVCGEWPAALGEYRDGLARADYDDRIRARLAWLLATSPSRAVRNGREAVAWAEEAVDVTAYQDLDALDALAAAYAGAGQFDRAIETSQRTTELVLRNGRPDLARQLGDRIAAFEREIALGDAGNPAVRLGETPEPAQPGC